MSSDLKGVNFVVEPSPRAFGRASPLQTQREQHLLGSPDTTVPTSHGHDAVPHTGQRVGRIQLFLALALQPLGEGPCLTQEAKDPWRDRRFKVARPGCGLTRLLGGRALSCEPLSSLQSVPSDGGVVSPEIWSTCLRGPQRSVSYQVGKSLCYRIISSPDSSGSGDWL